MSASLTEMQLVRFSVFLQVPRTNNNTPVVLTNLILTGIADGLTFVPLLLHGDGGALLALE